MTQRLAASKGAAFLCVSEEKGNGMNIELILKVADEIEAGGPEMPEFNMRYFKKPKEGVSLADWHKTGATVCNTAVCIAGHVAMMHGKEKGKLGLCRFIEQEAQKLLGLTENDAYKLFTPTDMRYEMSTYTREEAARVLRHLAATGIVDWSIIVRKENN